MLIAWKPKKELKLIQNVKEICAKSACPTRQTELKPAHRSRKNTFVDGRTCNCWRRGRGTPAMWGFPSYHTISRRWNCSCRVRILMLPWPLHRKRPRFGRCGSKNSRVCHVTHMWHMGSKYDLQGFAPHWFCLVKTNRFSGQKKVTVRTLVQTFKTLQPVS